MKKIKNKGFTLIELLVVVAIIGILAAVGVVAYNGYTAAAKKNAAKTMHAQTVKYISAEIQKCSLGESKFIGTRKDCPPTATKVVDGAPNEMQDKNAYDTTEKAVRNNASYALGYVGLTATNAKLVTVKTCIADVCTSADNQMTSTIAID